MGGAHAPRAAQLGVGEAIEEVGTLAGQDVVAGGVVLAPLEAQEAIEGQRLGERARGAVAEVEQQAVAAQPGGVGEHGLGGAGELAGDLAVAGAAEQAVENRHQQRGAFEPVAGAEGLVAEVTPAVTALVTLDAVGGLQAAEVTGADEVPARSRLAVMSALGVGTERGRLGGHVSLHDSRHRKPRAKHNHRSTTQPLRTRRFAGGSLSMAARRSSSARTSSITTFFSASRNPISIWPVGVFFSTFRLFFAPSIVKRRV